MRSLTHPLAMLIAGVLFPVISSAQIVINEIMYDPDSPQPEWVELHNPDSISVNIAGWTLQDRTSTPRTISEGTVPAKGFLILTKDTAALRSLYPTLSPLVRISLPGLNNSGDDVTLKDDDGNTVDSVSWRSSWGGNDDNSLERFRATTLSTNSDSWGQFKGSNRQHTGKTEFDCAV